MTAYYGVFNVTAPPGALGTYVPLVPNSLPDASNNTKALQAMVYALLDPMNSDFTNGQGGTLQFPSSQGPYYFAGGSISVGPGKPPSTSTYPASIIFMGTGQDSADKPLLIQTTDNDLFMVQNNPGLNDCVGGTTFQDLFIQYTVGSGSTLHAAIRVSDSPNDQDPAQDGGGLNVRIFRTVFQDCPASVIFQHSGQCHMLQCTVLSTGGNTNTQIGVVVGAQTGNEAAIETYITDCYFQTETYDGAQIGVAVYNSEHLRIKNTRIEAFAYGIWIKPAGNAFRTHLENVTIRETAGVTEDPPGTPAGGALLIQPQSRGSVTETDVVACEFGPGEIEGTAYTLGGVRVDATAGTVDVLRFISCTSIGWPGPGLQILGAANGSVPGCAHVEINGGEYSANGQGSGTLSAGINIGESGEAAGSISNVRIAGVSCIGYILAYTTLQQQYGIYIADGAQDVIVDHCDLTGDKTAAAFVGKGTGGAPTNVFVRGCNVTGYASASTGGAFAFTSPGTLQVTDCAGYNDQNATISTVNPTSGTSASDASTLAHGAINYYGPSMVTGISNSGTATHVHISGTGYPIPTSSFFCFMLNNPSDQWFVDETPFNFTWLGK